MIRRFNCHYVAQTDVIRHGSIQHYVVWRLITMNLAKNPKRRSSSRYNIVSLIWIGKDSSLGQGSSPSWKKQFTRRFSCSIFKPSSAKESKRESGSNEYANSCCSTEKKTFFKKEYGPLKRENGSALFPLRRRRDRGGGVDSLAGHIKSIDLYLEGGNTATARYQFVKQLRPCVNHIYIIHSGFLMRPLRPQFAFVKLWIIWWFICFFFCLFFCFFRNRLMEILPSLWLRDSFVILRKMFVSFEIVKSLEIDWDSPLYEAFSS